ncbi:MAG TPA: sigma-70 family RNA polymerase sigma factor [Chloroflexota bacterium]|nr:sigma-70 family RNA polymerase sigma factor [Chloroflexota bacterium]
MFNSLDDPATRLRDPTRYTRQARAEQSGALRVEPRRDGGLDALYQATHQKLYAYLRSRADGDAEAADLTQQVYLLALRAWERRPANPAAYVPWLFVIARNAATDLGRRRRECVSWETLPEALHPRAGENDESRMIRREALASLAELVAALPPAKRELLALRFGADLSYAEIAIVIGKREGAIKQEMSRLLRQLRERYDEA